MESKQTFDEIIIVLGNRNNVEFDDDGVRSHSSEMSALAKERHEAAAELLRQKLSEGKIVGMLFTGGAHKHLQTVPHENGKSHAEYAAESFAWHHPDLAGHVLNKYVRSIHTAEDAALSVPVVKRYADAHTRLTLVTSSFHKERALLTFLQDPFYREFSDANRLDIAGANNGRSYRQEEALRAHEKRKIEKYGLNTGVLPARS